MSPIIIADKLIEAVCEAAGVQYRLTRRLIIDAQVGHPIFVYFDTIGDDSLLTIVPPLATAPEVIRRYISNEQGEPVEVTPA